MRIIIVVMIVLCNCMGCVKIYEEVRQERIVRPVIEIDSISSPEWDLIME